MEVKSTKRILVTGPQGSGKTTQTNAVAKILGAYPIDSGDLIRAKAEEQNSDGQSLSISLEAGKLADDQIVGRLIKEEIEKVIDQDLVVDGYPRTLSQLAVFDPKYDVVFYLDISDKEALSRLEKRGRIDDTPELIAKRLELYHQRTEPVLQHYQTQGKLIRINGEQPAEEITKEILSYLN